MASNLTVDTLTKGATTLNTDELVDVNNTRVAKAWVNFDGTGTPAIRASFNTSSITDNGVGDYTINFTTAFPDANYALALSNNGYATNNNSVNIAVKGSSAGAVVDLKTTTAVRVNCASTSTSFDGVENNVAVFR
tara:strand:+ start:225 stop:629 length:405 start_codon:yes stop_codon:yes gene_type:complete